MEILIQILIATFLVSLISLSGAILFVWKEKSVAKYMILLVALAAGSLLGTAFFHLVPESVHLYDESHLEENVIGEHIEGIEEHESHAFLPSYFILFGILIFYIIEKFIRWHHHHDLDCHKHSISTLSLVGDWFHNFLDGALIAAAFFVDPKIGIATTIAIALHEIPQEIGDLSILLHSGFSKMKALLFNFISGLGAVVGAILMFLFAKSIESSIPYLVAFVAGTFIYLSLADIVPELNKKQVFPQYLISAIFLLGIGISFLTTFITH